MADSLTLKPENIDVPAQPESLAKLGALLAQEDVNLQEVARLIEHDMALAAAVMKAVNSPYYGLRGRVQNVQQATSYLGLREIAALTYEIGLRSVFPDAVELQAVWERACVRGLIMGRLANELFMDAWTAHTAGLFEECGKAVLFKHAPEVYRGLLKSSANDTELVEKENHAFGISHDVLGAELCKAWGMSAAAVASVHHHVHVQALRQLPPNAPKRGICVLSGLAHALMTDPASVDEVAAALAPQAMMAQALLVEKAHKVKDKIDDAVNSV
jgi:HD-like signal output (HDOD) protein